MKNYITFVFSIACRKVNFVLSILITSEHILKNTICCDITEKHIYIMLQYYTFVLLVTLNKVTWKHY